MNERFDTYMIATMLGVSRRRVLSIAAELNLKPYKIGRSVLFTKREIERMKRRNTKPGPKNGARK